MPMWAQDRSGSTGAAEGAVIEPMTVWEFISNYAGPDKTVRLLGSFACGSIDGCSGIMISPHIFMTAAHCGGPDHATRTVRFFRINEEAAPGPASQALSEPYRARSFPWQSFVEGGAQVGDTMLWWVEDGSDGVAPGHKYGFLELSDRAVQLGNQGYRFWVNPAPDIGLSSTLLYSSGEATARGPGEMPAGFTQYDIYGVPGVSGSAVVGLGDHASRVIGVTATADTAIRRCVDSSLFVSSHEADGNGVLDAIEYDLLITQGAASFHRLRVDTPWQRAQWRLAPGASWPATNSAFGWIWPI